MVLLSAGQLDTRSKRPVRNHRIRRGGFREPELGSAYLGTQGDEWDAQKDMASAFGGAALAMIVTFTTSRGFKKTAHRVVE